MIDLHLSAFAPRWRFLYAVRIDAYERSTYEPKAHYILYYLTSKRAFTIMVYRSKRSFTKEGGCKCLTQKKIY